MTEELSAPVAEQRFRLSIDHHDLAGRVDHHHCIRRGFDRQAKFLLGPLAFGDVQQQSLHRPLPFPFDGPGRVQQCHHSSVLTQCVVLVLCRHLLARQPGLVVKSQTLPLVRGIQPGNRIQRENLIRRCVTVQVSVRLVGEQRFPVSVDQDSLDRSFHQVAKHDFLFVQRDSCGLAFRYLLFQRPIDVAEFPGS